MESVNSKNRTESKEDQPSQSKEDEDSLDMEDEDSLDMERVCSHGMGMTRSPKLQFITGDLMESQETKLVFFLEDEDFSEVNGSQSDDKSSTKKCKIKSHGNPCQQIDSINNPREISLDNLCSLDPNSDQPDESAEQPSSQLKTFGSSNPEAFIGEGKMTDDPQTVKQSSPVNEVDGGHSAQRDEGPHVDSTKTPDRTESDLHPQPANHNRPSLCVSADEGEKEDAFTDIYGSSDLSVMRDDIPKQEYSSDNSTEAGINHDNDIEDEGDDCGETLQSLNEENQPEEEDEAETGGMQVNESDYPASTEAGIKDGLQPFLLST